MKELTITIPAVLPPELNPNWQPTGLSQAAYRGIRARAINEFHIRVFYCAVDARNRWWQNSKAWWEPLEKAVLAVTIILPPGAKAWDSTNARGALKHGEDALVMASIIQDDSPAHVHWEDVKWERGKEAMIIFQVKERVA